MRLLSPHQIDQFRNDGFLVVENLLDFETVEILRQRFEHLFRGEFETGISPDEVNWQVGESDPSLTRQICNGWKADFMIARTVFRTDLGRAIALLGNWPGTRLFQDNLLWKPPGARPIGTPPGQRLRRLANATGNRKLLDGAGRHPGARRHVGVGSRFSPLGTFTTGFDIPWTATLPGGNGTGRNHRRDCA